MYLALILLWLWSSPLELLWEPRQTNFRRSRQISISCLSKLSLPFLVLLLLSLLLLLLLNNTVFPTDQSHLSTKFHTPSISPRRDLFLVRNAVSKLYWRRTRHCCTGGYRVCLHAFGPVQKKSKEKGEQYIKWNKIQAVFFYINYIHMSLML